MRIRKPWGRYVPLLIGASVVPWLLISKLLVPRLIRQAYAGQGPPLLNRIISGQQQHPVDWYLSLWAQGIWRVAAFLVALALVAWVAARLDIARRWGRYWLRPTPLFDLAVVRVAVVGFEVVYLLVSQVRIREAMGYPDFMYAPLPMLRLLWPASWWGVRPPNDLVEVMLWATVAFGFLGLIGLRTRLSLAIFAYGALFLHAFGYSFGDHHHAEALLMMALPILAFAPSGTTLSLDSWLRWRSTHDATERPGLTREMSAEAGWPLRLIQWLFVVAYLSAVVIKLTESGVAWLDGYTLQYYLLRDGARWGADLGVVLSQYHTPAVLLSWVTLGFEATFGLAVLVPRLRWLYIPLAILLHVGIYVTMRAPFFQYVALYSVFVPWRLVVGRWLGGDELARASAS